MRSEGMSGMGGEAMLQHFIHDNGEVAGTKDQDDPFFLSNAMHVPCIISNMYRKSWVSRSLRDASHPALCRVFATSSLCPSHRLPCSSSPSQPSS